jgi:hypothetical protein
MGVAVGGMGVGVRVGVGDGVDVSAGVGVRRGTLQAARMVIKMKSAARRVIFFIGPIIPALL